MIRLSSSTIARKDLVTSFCLLTKLATPTRAVALRLSSPLLKKEAITLLLFCTLRVPK